jgi:hypothetical protein
MTRYEKMTYGFAALVSGFGLLLIWTTVFQVAITRGDVGTGSVPQQSLPVLPDVASDDSLENSSVIAERPIFVSSRHAPPGSDDNANSNAPASGVAPPFSVIGIMIADGNQLISVKRAGDREAKVLRIGQSLDGWTIDAIQNNTVVLRSGDARQTLHLADDKKSESKQ